MASSVARVAWGSASAAGGRFEAYRLLNARGVQATVVNFGATLVSVKVPSAACPSAADAEEVTLCRGESEAAIAAGPYMGVTVGRVANRIAGGVFSLDGRRVGPLAINNGANHLHGGAVGWNRAYWTAAPFTSPSGVAGVAFTHVSNDGDEGYPGRVHAESRYELTPDNELIMTFSATSDAATPINICNHAYWNLSGGFAAATIEGHTLQSPCTHYLPVDGGSIPTGEVAPVAGTPFDFSVETPVGARLRDVDGAERGYDHCLCRAGPGGVPPAGLGLGRVATLRDPASGRAMTVETTAPGVQLYTANYLAKDAAEAPFTQYAALCLETQNYPDAINRPGVFPNAVLRPDETYSHVARHTFSW